MKENTTSPEEIARMRADLDTIQSAIGGGLPFDKMDIRFCWAIAASTILFGILDYLGYNEGSGFRPALIPLLLTAGAYFISMAIRGRRRSQAAPTIKTENRLGAMVAILIAVSIPLLRHWAISQELDMKTLDTILVITIGIATFAMSFLPFTTAPAFRRLSIGGSGVAIIVIGLLIPTLTPESRTFTLCGCLLVVIVFQALLMQYFLNRQVSPEPANSSDGQ